MKIKAFTYRIIMFIWKINPLKQPSAFFIKKLPLPIDKLYKDLKFNGEFTIKVDSQKSFKMIHHFHTTIENEVFWKGIDNGWEKHTIHIWKYFSEQSNFIFDVGANTGLFSLLSKTINLAATIYSFEPSRRTFEKLKKNLEINQFKNIILNNTALSNKNSTATFFDYDSEHQYSASLNQQMSIDRPEGKKLNYQVKTQTFDSYISENNILGVDLLKIDVEMHEPEVLEGMKESISKFRPVIIIEILNDTVANYTNTFFSNKNYLFYIIDETQGLISTHKMHSHNSNNCLLVPSELDINSLLNVYELDNKN